MNTPTEAWLKEAEEAAEKAALACNCRLSPQPRAHAALFLSGARWAQEKGVMEMSPEESKKHNDAMLSFFGDEKAAAPGEESWEKLREQAFAEKEKEWRAFPVDERDFNFGFDAAVSLIARPLLAELERWKEWGKRRDNDAATANFDLVEARAELASLKNRFETEVRACELALEAERKLRAELASLRADLDKAAAVVECKDREISRFRQERYTLRAQHANLSEQLAEAITTLELIAGPVEFYCEIGERNKQAAAQATLAKLKAGRKEGSPFRHIEPSAEIKNARYNEEKK